jgi:hypothetical protein
MTDAQLFGAASARYSAFTDAAAAPIPIALNDDSAPNITPADFEYEFEGAALRACSTGIRFDGVGNEYALDSLSAHTAEPAFSATRFHHATVIRMEGYIFTGRSGAGKSTVASLSPEGTYDEISCSAAKMEVASLRHSFWGEFRAAGSNTSAPWQYFSPLAST